MAAAAAAEPVLGFFDARNWLRHVDLSAWRGFFTGSFSSTIPVATMLINIQQLTQETKRLVEAHAPDAVREPLLRFFLERDAVAFSAIPRAIQMHSMVGHITQLLLSRGEPMPPDVEFDFFNTLLLLEAIRAFTEDAPFTTPWPDSTRVLYFPRHTKALDVCWIIDVPKKIAFVTHITTCTSNNTLEVYVHKIHPVDIPNGVLRDLKLRIDPDAHSPMNQMTIPLSAFRTPIEMRYGLMTALGLRVARDSLATRDSGPRDIPRRVFDVLLEVTHGLSMSDADQMLVEHFGREAREANQTLAREATHTDRNQELEDDDEARPHKGRV